MIQFNPHACLCNTGEKEDTLAVDYGDNAITGEKYMCPICRVDRSAISLSARIHHLKACAKKHHLDGNVELFRNRKRWMDMTKPKHNAALKKTTTNKKKTSAAAVGGDTAAVANTGRRSAKRRRAVGNSSDLMTEEPENVGVVKSKFFLGNEEGASHETLIAAISKFKYKKRGSESKTMSTTEANVTTSSTEKGSSKEETKDLSKHSPNLNELPNSRREKESEVTIEYNCDIAVYLLSLISFNEQREMNYDEVIENMDEEDEQLMIAVALSTSLQDNPQSEPESPGLRDLAGFKITSNQQQMQTKCRSDGINEVVKVNPLCNFHVAFY